MSSFLEGIESNTTDIVPPEPPTASTSGAGGISTVSTFLPTQPAALFGAPIITKSVANKQALRSRTTAKKWPSAASTSTFPGLGKGSPLHSSRMQPAGLGSSLMQEDPLGGATDGNFEPGVGTFLVRYFGDVDVVDDCVALLSMNGWLAVGPRNHAV